MGNKSKPTIIKPINIVMASWFLSVKTSKDYVDHGKGFLCPCDPSIPVAFRHGYWHANPDRRTKWVRWDFYFTGSGPCARAAYGTPLKNCLWVACPGADYSSTGIPIKPKGLPPKNVWVFGRLGKGIRLPHGDLCAQAGTYNIWDFVGAEATRSTIEGTASTNSDSGESTDSGRSTPEWLHDTADGAFGCCQSRPTDAGFVGFQDWGSSNLGQLM